MIKIKKHPRCLAKKVNFKPTLHHPHALKKIGQGVCLGILIPAAIYYGLSHRKE